MKALIYLASALDASNIITKLQGLNATGVQLESLTRFLAVDIPADSMDVIRSWTGVLEVEKDTNNFEAQGTQPIGQGDNWGLDRIDQEQLPLNGLYQYSRTASNVDVYVVDSGINVNHEEFYSGTKTARVTRLYDYRVDLDIQHVDRILPNSASYAIDDHGHGTHVASIIGGAKYGVAKRVTLKAVKVFSDSLQANTSWILRGLDAILDDHLTKPAPTDPAYRPSVANFSFSSTQVSTILSAAIQALMDAGVICVAAAGNNGLGIVKFSQNVVGSQAPTVCPGSLDTIVTVGAIGRNDAKTTTSNGIPGTNYGSAVDTYAPGETVVGAWRAELNNYNTSRTLSGTSVSAGFVTGTVALYLEDFLTLYVESGPSSIAQSGVRQFIQDTNSYGAILRNVFVPGDMQWITPEGLLQTFGEDQPILFQLRASNGKNAPLVYSFLHDSDRIKASLAGIGLTGEGLLYGTANPVQTSDPDYIFVDGLPEEERVLFPANIKGYLDLTLTVLVQDKVSTLSNYNYQSQSRDFVLRILDTNLPPIWTDETPLIQLDQLDQFSEFYFTVGNEIHIDLRYDLPFHIIDADGDVIDWNTTNGVPKLLIGSLPPGLTLDSDGVISGTLLPFSSDDGGKSRDYQFIVRAYDGRLYVDKFFAIFVRRISEGNHAPVWNEDNSKNYNSGPLVDLTLGQAVLIRVEAFDADADLIDFSSEDISLTAPTENIPGTVGYNNAQPTRVHGLPTGVYMDSDGTLRGVVDPSNRLGQYFFQITVSDGFDNGSTPRVFRIDVLDDSAVSYFTPISNVYWITPSGLLGTLEETQSSHFEVRGRTNMDIPLVYVMSNSQLPEGLYLDALTGDIRGNAPYVSEDTVYEFKIKAYMQKNENVFAVRTFSIAVKNKFSAPISVVRCTLLGPEKTEILNFIRSSKVFESQNTDLIYKPADRNFGIKNDLTMYVLGGLPILTPEQIHVKLRDDLPTTDPEDFNHTNVTPVSNFHRNTTCILGNIKLAKARDTSGTVLYEVLYVEVYDANYRAGGFIDGEPDPVEYAHQDLDDPTSPELIFPTSIMNWRNDLIQTPNGLVGEEHLPLWMTSQQILGDETSALGFVPAIELMYLNAGYPAQSIMASLQVTDFNTLVRNKRFTIDRYVWENWTNPNDVRKRFYKFLPGDIH